MRRRATETDGTFTLREPGEAYSDVCASENDALRLDNGRFWEERRDGTATYLGPTRRPRQYRFLLGSVICTRGERLIGAPLVLMTAAFSKPPLLTQLKGPILHFPQSSQTQSGSVE